MVVLLNNILVFTTDGLTKISSELNFVFNHTYAYLFAKFVFSSRLHVNNFVKLNNSACYDPANFPNSSNYTIFCGLFCQSL